MRTALAILTLAATVLVAACGGGSGLTGTNLAVVRRAPRRSRRASPWFRIRENYTVEFKSDGPYSMKADCNQVNGSYTTSGSSLTIQPGASTLVACARRLAGRPLPAADLPDDELRDHQRPARADPVRRRDDDLRQVGRAPRADSPAGVPGRRPRDSRRPDMVWQFPIVRKCRTFR